MLSYGTHPKRWQDVKICTYAMCKNELKFVESWVKNVWLNKSYKEGYTFSNPFKTKTVSFSISYYVFEQRRKK